MSALTRTLSFAPTALDYSLIYYCRQALVEVRQGMRAMGDAVLELLKSKPELKLALRTPEQLAKLHERDFVSLTTQSLTLQEARALYAAMPTFRKELEKQNAWVDSLKSKIEAEMTRPSRPAPPPIAKKVRRFSSFFQDIFSILVVV